MQDKQTILTISKLLPAPFGQGTPSTAILSFKEPHLAKQHLDAFIHAESTLLAGQTGANPETVFAVPRDTTVPRRIITEQSGQLDFSILGNKYNVAWLNIEGNHHVTDDEVQACLDAFVNSSRTASEYAQVAQSIAKTMHRYCQAELWKFVKALIAAFAQAPYDDRNRSAHHQAERLQAFIETENL